MVRGGSGRALLAGLLLACLQRRVSGSTESGASCQDLGFTGLQLCSDCDRFFEYVKDQELADDCRKCCTQDTSSSTTIFKTAILEIDTNRFRDFPNVEDFLNKHHKKLFKDSLTVQYRWASPPRLILKAGKERLTIRIDSWKTEHILEFLQEKLGMAKAKSGA